MKGFIKLNKKQLKEINAGKPGEVVALYGVQEPVFPSPKYGIRCKLKEK